MSERECGGVWIFAEQRGGRLVDVDATVNLLGKGLQLAKELNTDISAVLIGYSNAEELVEHGADRVYWINAPGRQWYQSDIYAEILSNLIKRKKPAIVLMLATSIGKDLAARVAAKVKTGLISHCVDLYIEEGRLVHVVPCSGGNGNMMAKVINEGTPQIATIMPGMTKRMNVKGKERVREKEEKQGRKGGIIEIKGEWDKKEGEIEVLEMIKEERKEEQIETAKRIVAGGWGLISSSEGFELVKELAEVLNASVGGTRPAMDEGCITPDRMIGQSGKVVAPDLYVALGISGAAQHTVGVLDSKVIFAINRDENAPIFDICDVGIVGDVKEIIPLLIEELKKREKNM
jgi:electron transfer flavoprotein alpha subunit